MGGVSAVCQGFGARRLPSLYQRSGSNGQSPQIHWDVFLAGPKKSRYLCPAGRGKPLGTPEVIWELPLLFLPTPRLLGAHIPSPGHAKDAGIWLPELHMAVPAQGTRHSARATAGRFRHGSSPVVGKTRPVLSKQPGPGQCLTPAPCPAAWLDMRTWGHWHGPSDVTSPSSVPQTRLRARSWGHAARPSRTPGNPHCGMAPAELGDRACGGHLGTQGAWGPEGWRRGWLSLSWGSGRKDASLHSRAWCCCIPEPGGDTGDSLVPPEGLLCPTPSPVRAAGLRGGTSQGAAGASPTSPWQSIHHRGHGSPAQRGREALPHHLARPGEPAPVQGGRH